MSPDHHDGRSTIQLDGFSYLSRFISTAEADELIEYFTGLAPIWEQRHGPQQRARAGGRSRRITRPVYWLGAWQFASLGYYAEPHHREGRCLRAEPFPPTMQTILRRLRPLLGAHDRRQDPAPLPNTCLINYYGSELSEGPPVDQARLRMHRDGEPGPIIMFCIGQPGSLEFVEPDHPETPALSLWTRHRSVVVFSGPSFKDRLYHRLTQVRHGATPQLTSPVPNFSLRRISVSFRHVPEPLIADFDGLPPASREQIRPYVQELARSSTHYAEQLLGASRREPSTTQDEVSDLSDRGC